MVLVPIPRQLDRRVAGIHDTVNLQLDMPNVHYITVRTIANAIMLLALCGRSPAMSAMDLARYYKQWFTRSRFFGTHCRYWASAVGPAIIMSLSMLFGGKVCSNIAQRGSDLIAHFVQTMVDLIQPKDPKVRRWYDVQLWASKQKRQATPSTRISCRSDTEPQFCRIRMIFRSALCQDLKSTCTACS